LFVDTASRNSAAVGVFEKEFAGAQAALVAAVDDVNRGRKRDSRDGYKLSVDVHTIPHDDSFTAAKTG